MTHFFWWLFHYWKHFLYYISFHRFSILKYYSFWWHLKSCKEPQLTWSLVREVRRLLNLCNAEFCYKILNELGYMGWSIVTMNQPVATLPQLWSFPSISISEVKIYLVVIFIDSLTFRTYSHLSGQRKY